MNLLQELNEQDEDQDHSEALDRFVSHANSVGLRSKRDKSKWGKTFAMAFAMRDKFSFDVAFKYHPRDYPTSVMIEYVLGAGKHYNITVPLERFMSFEKDEVELLHKIIQQNSDEYVKAVKLVKEMPKAIKEIIKLRVK